MKSTMMIRKALYGSQKIFEYSYIHLVAEGQRLSFFLGKLPLQIVHLWIDIINIQYP